MSLIKLRTFIEVYRQRSISAAAKALNLTQPAVSQHINALEIAIGKLLFERLPHGVKPTLTADDLAADIGCHLDAVEIALSSARARSMNVSGTLQIIGHANFMAEKLTGKILPLLKSGIRVCAHTGDGSMVAQMVMEGHCDFGITAHPVTDIRLKSEIIFTDEVIVVADPEIAARINHNSDAGNALLQEPLLAYDLELPLITEWLGKNKIKFEQLLPAMIGKDLRAQRNILCQGFGWAVMPKFLCQSQISAGILEQIIPPIGNTEIIYRLIWLSSSLHKPRLAHARQTLLREFNKHI